LKPWYFGFSPIPAFSSLIGLDALAEPRFSGASFIIEPDSWGNGKGRRELSVSLASSPDVNSSRRPSLGVGCGALGFVDDVSALWVKFASVHRAGKFAET
jgi:hypothetical protein